MAPKKKLAEFRMSQQQDDGTTRTLDGYEVVEKFAQMGCTQAEIGSFIGISADTIQRDKKAKAAFKKGMDMARISVRRAQMKAAVGGNITMQIWLGKQMLGQKDMIVAPPSSENKVRVVNMIMPAEDTRAPAEKK